MSGNRIQVRPFNGQSRIQASWFWTAVFVAAVSWPATGWAQPQVLLNQGNITKEALSGLEWLDITLTTGRSYNQMLSEFSNSFSDFFGFRHATQAEVTDLFIGAGLTGINGGQQNSEVKGVRLLSLIGFTSTDTRNGRQFPQALGVTGTPGGAGQFTAQLLHRFLHYLAINSGSTFRTTSHPTIGHWLVRQGTPETPPVGFGPTDPRLAEPRGDGCGLDGCFGLSFEVDQNDPYGVGTTNPAYIAAPLADGYQYDVTGQQSNVFFQSVIIPQQEGLLDGDILALTADGTSFNLEVGTPFDLFQQGIFASSLSISGVSQPISPFNSFGTAASPSNASLTAGFTFSGSFFQPTTLNVTATSVAIPEPSSVLVLLGTIVVPAFCRRKI